MIGEPTPDLRKPPALLAANILLDIEAIHIRPNEPFTFTSGRLSPVYVDCRKIISFPRARTKLMQMATDLILEKIGPEALDAVAGGETAGIPFAAWISEMLGLPMLYVRKQAKGFGRNSQIEGTFSDGARILLVEDLATDGGSKINFINAIRKARGKIDHCFVVFHYGNFPESVQNLSAIGVKLHGLCNWWDVLEVAASRGFSTKQLDIVRDFLDHPDGWIKRQK